MKALPMAVEVSFADADIKTKTREEFVMELDSVMQRYKINSLKVTVNGWQMATNAHNNAYALGKKDGLAGNN